MKKNKIVIIILILGILFLTSYLYNTYATSTGVSLGNDENTYDILLNDSTDTVSVPAKSSKTVYYQFSNTNKGTVKYHIGYTSDNVIAKVWWNTEDRVSGTIEYGEYKFIKLKLINDTTEDDTITIKPVLGYVNGGDVIPDSNTTLVTGTINETNIFNVSGGWSANSTFAETTITRPEIETISFVNDNIVPDGVLGSFSVSSDGSVMLWYTAGETEGLYNVFIGSDNGIVSLKNGNRIFDYMSNLKSIDFKTIDTSNVTDMASMFMYDSQITKLDLSSFDTSNVTDMNSMFSSCKKLQEVDLSSFNTSNVTNMSGMFSECRNLISLDVSNFNTSSTTNMSKMFEYCDNLSSLDISSFDTSSVKNMRAMFYLCPKLQELDVHHFDTSKVENMEYLFSGLKSVKTLDLSNFNTTNVSNMQKMFTNSSALEALDLSSFNTNKINSLNSMFSGCTNLKYLDVSSFNTSGVKNMYQLFSGCSSLMSLDLSNFDTGIVETMQYMFYGCSKLEELDLSNFNTINVSTMQSMFYGCRKLTTLDMRNAEIPSSVTYTNMLTNVPTTINIYLKDTQGNRDFMSNNFSTYTNVQYIPSS